MEQSEFEITVVIPVYNRAGIVGRTLETLDAQVFQDFYVILVDNNSTDGTLEVLQQWAGKHPGRATVLMQPTPGAAAARQMGLDAVATPWTIFFDSDDEMSAMHLANIVKTIDLHPDADIIGWETRMIRNGKIYRKGAFTTRDMQFRSLFNGIMATLRYCARTELFRAAGGWDPQVRIWDDIELGARLIKRAGKVCKVKAPVSVFTYLQDDSISMAETVSNTESIDTALGRISRTLGPERAHWVELKRIILAASGDGAEAYRLRDQALSRVSSPLRRQLFRLAFAWTKAGLPGAARILRPFL